MQRPVSDIRHPCEVNPTADAAPQNKDWYSAFFHPVNNVLNTGSV